MYLVSTLASHVGEVDLSDKIAVIKIEGAIASESTSIPFQSAGASAEKLIEFLDDAEQSADIKGILLEINSPGGTVVASKSVAEKVKAMNKPVVAYIKDIGTSGAYWIASASDVIVADPLSITGSIGVIASYLEFSDLLEKYGITYTSLKSGELKEIGSPFKGLTQQERDILQKKLDKIHEAFIVDVAANRNLPVESVRNIASGVYYLGEEGKEFGLVDVLGSRELAMNITKEKANAPDAGEVIYEQKETLLDLVSQLSTHAAYNVGQGLASGLQKVDSNIKIKA